MEMGEMTDAWERFADPVGTARRSGIDQEIYKRLAGQDRDSELERRVAMAQQFGQDIYEDGQVLRFTRQLRDATTGAPRTLIYAAVKAAGLWYLTGRQQKPMTWRELLAWLVSGDFPTNQVEVCTAYAILGEQPEPSPTSSEEGGQITWR